MTLLLPARLLTLLLALDSMALTSIGFAAPEPRDAVARISAAAVSTPSAAPTIWSPLLDGSSENEDDQDSGGDALPGAAVHEPASLSAGRLPSGARVDCVMSPPGSSVFRPPRTA